MSQEEISLEALRQQTEKYGPAFAEKVANGLVKGGWVGYGHPYYCGMGLEYRDGTFKYGEINDGYFAEPPTLQWSTKESFVAWLAEQSDASLARFEDSPGYWGNQTINRKRLLVLAVKGDRKRG
ncbi:MULTISPECIES: hypothetical protein [Niastella]|uniref:Uncharacterized protein n=1 Tax=Niastella soli TaxID=2821487 RepID=A0ABS3Z2Q6_9BACT|nr:hypothetical protein [Niastella soli]MBO9204410.1 hypothetical protein [Niastella soli]